MTPLLIACSCSSSIDPLASEQVALKTQLEWFIEEARRLGEDPASSPHVRSRFDIVPGRAPRRGNDA